MSQSGRPARPTVQQSQTNKSQTVSNQTDANQMATNTFCNTRRRQKAVAVPRLQVGLTWICHLVLSIAGGAWRLDGYSTYDEAPIDSGDSDGDDDGETTNGDHDGDHDAAVMDMELSDFSD